MKSFRWTKARKNIAAVVASGLLVAIPIILSILAFNDQRPDLADIPQTKSGELLGVDPNHFEYAVAAQASFPQSFMADAGDQSSNARKNARIWLVTRSVSVPGKPAGQDFGIGPQQTGDCVSWGGSRPISECLAAQIARGESTSGGVVFQPYYYGVTRRNGDQHGYGQIGCRSSGAIPSLLALNFPKYGPVFYHEVEAEGIKYSGKLADAWGCNGVPEKWLQLGLSRPGGESYPIRNLEELRDALCSAYPCSYAGPFTPGRKYKQDGRNCMEWNGRLLGYHQMCVLAYDGSAGEGKEYFYIQNSHGADKPNHQVTAATEPLQDEPEGGFWVTWATMQKMLADKGEIWAFSAVKGFEKRDIDWSEWDVFRADPQRAEPQKEKQDEDSTDDRRADARRMVRTLAI